MAKQRYYTTAGVFEALHRTAKFSVVHLDLIDGRLQPGALDDDLDAFELEMGNTLVYASPIWTRGDRLERLRAEWLPYYREELRLVRLDAIQWIREEVVEILGLPELYARLPRLFEVQRFESDELAGKAEELQRLLEAYVVP